MTVNVRTKCEAGYTGRHYVQHDATVRTWGTRSTVRVHVTDLVEGLVSPDALFDALYFVKMTKMLRWDLLQLSPVRSVLAAAALILLVAKSPCPAQAQLNEFGIGAGIAAAVSEINTRQGPGLHLLGYAGFPVNVTLQFRGEAAFVQLNGKPYSSNEGPVGESRPDLRVASVGGTLVYTPRGTGTGVYGFVGAGMYQLSAGGESDELVPGASLGVGTNLNVGGAGLFAQARLEVPLSSFASGTESAPNVYLPVTLGLRVPCCGARQPGT